MKKFYSIFLENVLFFLVCFLIIDFAISNTILNLKDKDCRNYEEFYLSLKKNCGGKEKLKAYLPTTKLYTDQDGLRIKKGHIRSSKDKVFVFGSSFVYGAGLEYEESVIGLLEETHKKFEFYNFSSGYSGPSIHLYNLKKKINSKEIPKKIILILSLSDIHNESAIWKGYDQNGRPLLASNKIYLQSKIKETFIKKNFRLSRSLAHTINNSLRAIRTSANVKSNIKIRTTIQAGYTYQPIEKLKPFYTEKTFSNGKSLLKRKIKDIAYIASENNVELYLVIFPFADTLEYGQKIFDWENYTKNICSEISCKFVNTFDNFRNYKKKNVKWYSDLFFRGDEHFTRKGHAILSEKLTKDIFQ